jgi:hypothetical protein
MQNAVVGGDLAQRVAGVDLGLEYLHLLAGNLCTFDATDQLLGFARKHAAADDLDPSPGVIFGVRAERPLVLHETLDVISHV